MQRVILILSATLVAFLGAGGVSGAAEIHGRVVRIADGDTLTLVTGGSRTPARASASRTAFVRGIPVASAAGWGQPALPLSWDLARPSIYGVKEPKSAVGRTFDSYSPLAEPDSPDPEDKVNGQKNPLRQVRFSSEACQIFI